MRRVSGWNLPPRGNLRRWDYPGRGWDFPARAILYGPSRGRFVSSATDGPSRLVTSEESILSQHPTPARALAEAAFKSSTRPIAIPEFEVRAQMLRERTARLRELRLAKESAAIRGE